MKPVKIKYSAQQIRKAIRYYWWKQVGLPYLSMLIPIIVILSYQIYLDDYNWLVVVIGLGVIIFSASMVYLYLEYIKTPLTQLRSMKVPVATLELEEEQFRITSDAWVLEIDWNSIRDIWHSNNVWILEFSRHKFMILPVVELTQEAKTFIISRIKSVLYHTGQAWKIRAYDISARVSVFFVFGPLVIDSFPRHWDIFSYITGYILCVSAIVFLFSIRCPICRKNLNSKATKKLSYGLRWPDWLLALDKCPYCGATKFSDKKEPMTSDSNDNDRNSAKT